MNYHVGVTAMSPTTRSLRSSAKMSEILLSVTLVALLILTVGRVVRNPEHILVTVSPPHQNLCVLGAECRKA